MKNSYLKMVYKTHIAPSMTRKDGEARMDKEKVKRIYERLENALTEENCTYEEAKTAVDKLREDYFNRKAGNLLKKTTIQEIASTAL